MPFFFSLPIFVQNSYCIWWQGHGSGQNQDFKRSWSDGCWITCKDWCKNAWCLQAERSLELMLFWEKKKKRDKMYSWISFRLTSFSLFCPKLFYTTKTRENVLLSFWCCGNRFGIHKKSCSLIVMVIQIKHSWMQFWWLKKGLLGLTCLVLCMRQQDRHMKITCFLHPGLSS